MKLVQLTSELSRRFGDERAIRMIKDAGFDGFDLTMRSIDGDLFRDGYEEKAKRLKALSDELGLPCLQAHAPSPRMRTMDQVMPLVGTFLRAIDVAAILECGHLVIHPGAFLSAEENKIFYDQLLPYAEKRGVLIATENMFKWKDETKTETVPAACGTSEDFLRHLDVINHPSLTACLDLGHAEMVNCEGAVNMIRALGNRIGCLHVHDNDLYHDLHVFPFVGDADWNAITAALREVGYNGAFTFEADYFLKKFPDELLPACLSLLEKTGRYLISLIEK